LDCRELEISDSPLVGGDFFAGIGVEFPHKQIPITSGVEWLLRF
jgi:hypothetical protein